MDEPPIRFHVLASPMCTMPGEAFFTMLHQTSRHWDRGVTMDGCLERGRRAYTRHGVTVPFETDGIIAGQRTKRGPGSSSTPE
ncbi:hypothetical protein AWV79_27385 [Cupriavidus sp. UYMMa02A]|nr:hypothetical protein AWV79_27385 [Cupriavidus sp. UYMMa02A]